MFIHPFIHLFVCFFVRSCDRSCTRRVFKKKNVTSTVDCIFIFFSIISKVLNNGEKLYCTFIDYEKAFDRVDRSLLWHKLIYENVSSKFVRAMKSMYNVVKSCVRYKSSLSGFVNSQNGLKQGDPSSPLMFMMFINDIIDNINTNLENIFTLQDMQLFMLLYADDAVVFSTSRESLQSMLNDIELYCGTWGLKINTSKTKVMIFEKGRPTTCDLYLNNVKLEVVNSFKYLGVHIFKNGHWLRMQKRLAQHANYALHNLFSIFKQTELPISDKCKLFDALVGSILNYSSEVWGTYEAKDVEMIHTKYCRWVLNVIRSTNISGLYGELGRVPMIVYRKFHMLKYWSKLLKSGENTITKKVYNMLKSDADTGVSYGGSNWAYQIESILDDIGLSYVWLQQAEIDVPLSLIKQRLFDSYYQSWYSNINNSNRLLSYAGFKHEFKFEKYLDFIGERKYRTALSKFRLSSHNLNIERGRYEGIPRDERLCNVCNMNAVETEYHFLLVCPRYTDLRRKFLKPYFCHWPSINKFNTLLMGSSKPAMIKTAKFIYYASQLRQETLR